MTVPPSYKTSSEYIGDALSFLKNHQWIFNYNNTHVLVYKVFSKFPSEWVTYFNNVTYEELNRLPNDDQLQMECPVSLKSFIDKIRQFNPIYTTENYLPEPKMKQNNGVSMQKLHEVSSLAPVVDRICTDHNINFIIDVGSGLGYLPHLLSNEYHHRVLGIECKAEFVDQAYKIQDKNYPQCKNMVKFARHFIDNSSDRRIRDLYEQYFGPIGTESGCLTGLHACADLSITILDLFAKMDFVKTLVIMPCCYHRIAVEAVVGEREIFKNFPASRIFSERCQEYEAQTFLRRPFLRLACQQVLGKIVRMNEEEHENHARNLMFRAILQEVVESANWNVKRIKRKSNMNYIPNADEHFSTYITNVRKTHRLENTQDEKIHMDNETFMQEMLKCWNKNKMNTRMFEALNILQAMLQSICENLILLDRVELLKEKGFHCEVKKLTDEVMSPRCFALVVVKDSS